MAVLPWGHSRTRTTSNEKRSHSALDWFTRPGTAEPSRQALTLLIKQHTKAVSTGTNSVKEESRSSTAQSHCSSHSQQLQDSSTTADHTAHASSSRPTSPRPLSPTYSIASAFERPETPSRSLFSRGNSLRRKGSKMSINSEIGTSSAAASPSRFSPSRLVFRRKESVSSPANNEIQALAISQPFAFQHVTHTEQNHFTALSRIDESELATHFGALQASQRAEHGLRGIQADKLSPINRERPCSPPPTKTTDLPMTPPRPAPPPKDSPQPVPYNVSPDIRLSRSMENFSRPTPRSPTSPLEASPLRFLPSLLPTVLESDRPEGTSSPKPLPHLPPVVHAVSTEDGSARRLMNAPLPIPPRDQSLMQTAYHRRQTSSKSSLRHMSTFPSPRSQKLGSPMQESRPRVMRGDKTTLPRHRSEDALSKYPGHTDSCDTPVSPVDDWEEAIDYAWDHADSQTMDDDAQSDATSTGVPIVSGESVVTILQPEGDQPSLPSTPLMMGPSASSNSLESQYDDRELYDALEYQVVGLGIDGDDTSNKAIDNLSKPPALSVTIPEDPVYDGMYHLPRTTYSALSKSSSQESIILSIASSIMGTQRSSNSSMNPTDMARLSTCDEPLSSNPSTSSPLLSVDNSKGVRPESTCVPLALLRGFAASDTETEMPVPKSENKAFDTHASDFGEDTVPPLPSNDSEGIVGASMNHQRQPSSTALNARASRQRSSTQTSRRNGRASYSLFPSGSSQSLNSQSTT